jgi:SAM-dependent methyltransferase
MTRFGSPESSHAHSLTVLESLYQFDDFMQSLKHVADMGCGSGLDMLWWATRTTRDVGSRPLNIRCTGIDIAESCAATNRHKYISYVPQDFEQAIRVHKTRFDLIWCHDAFQYVQDPFRTLKQWRDVASPNAVLILMVPQTTTFALNREQIEQHDGCYWHWTLINLIHVLAVSGWDCARGFFQKNAGDPWITAVVYRGNHEPLDPRRTRWYELCDLGILPESAVKCIQRLGYLRQQDLVLPWIDKSLSWIGKF